MRLVDGQRWDQGFIRGLASSDVFVPLVSAGAVEPLVALDCSDGDSGGGDGGGESLLRVHWVAVPKALRHGAPMAGGGGGGRSPSPAATSCRHDNVLLEWMLALYLFNEGRIKAILPLLMGKPRSITQPLLGIAANPPDLSVPPPSHNYHDQNSRLTEILPMFCDADTDTDATKQEL
eukprot:SAG25_NODE_79_length_16803_cov_43.538194_9_plen_177_part_00